ncbi:L,D-transpeptidase family protein [Clostridium uliginosum]|uniref:L,D-transpeptidase catalytic domain n=1 Tax=Clostridium uliginosum TaxID=119641 RepID=A0A1I1MM68_9CLOT|nr:peptidoglycan binding domain-containing protein [Clostridium uliginosum]SFC86481.1 L,D-transpeptidase catalytic domain [Clostridium uliginosum]
MKKRRHKHSKNKKGLIISLCTLMAMYLGVSVFFMNHFYFGSQINGIDIAGKTVKQADEQISSAISTYALELEERGDMKEEIKGDDIGLAYDPKDKIKNLKDSQNPLGWLTSLFSKSHSQIDGIVTFDENSLKEKLNKLSSFNSSDIIEPKDASFKYTDNGYEIVDEVNGNKINKDTIYENVGNAILAGKKTLNLDAENCYENPKYTSKSKEVIDAKDLFNKYTSLKITYTFADKKEAIDGSTINKWLDVDKDMNVVFNEKKVRSYVDSLASKYNTFGKTRDFVTSSAKTIQVSGGNYGWIINKSEEVKDLIEIVKKGQDITKEPIYSQTGVSRDNNDIGDTYVELDMTKQHLWFYKKGSLITEGDVVTGNVSNNCGTPVGTYRLTYKEKHATLKGENYAAPVDFWLPFNGNIGIHDATWRSQFGKDIYMTSGSHGCVNAPYELANKIFDNIDAGTPIVCYSE